MEYRWANPEKTDILELDQDKIIGLIPAQKNNPVYSEFKKTKQKIGAYKPPKPPKPLTLSEQIEKKLGMTVAELKEALNSQT